MSRAAQFVREFDSKVGPLLCERGFQRQVDAAYLREIDEGRDLIGLFMSRNGTCAVPISRDPFFRENDRMRPPAETPLPILDRYLAPDGVVSYPFAWSFRTTARLERSIESLIEVVQGSAFGWLEAMRDPIRYRREIPPEFRLQTALAAERAGHAAAARAIYREIFTTLESVLDRPPRGLAYDIARKVLFVAERLELQDPRLTRFRERLDEESM